MLFRRDHLFFFLRNALALTENYLDTFQMICKLFKRFSRGRLSRVKLVPGISIMKNFFANLQLNKFPPVEFVSGGAY